MTGISSTSVSYTHLITGTYEDIHSFVEAMLIERTGETGKKLHTGRSRNDQVALDMKLYTRDEIKECDALLKDLLEEILTLMESHTETFMPGFTHLQKAQPLTLAHHFGAYFEMFKRDRSRLADIYRRMNTCPLGAGALAGTTYPLDRAYTAELLGFEDVYKRQAVPCRMLFFFRLSDFRRLHEILNRSVPQLFYDAPTDVFPPTASTSPNRLRDNCTHAPSHHKNSPARSYCLYCNEYLCT